MENFLKEKVNFSYGKQYCGVPQCHNYRSKGISLHRLPLYVKNSKNMCRKWMSTLRMGKKFSNLLFTLSKK